MHGIGFVRIFYAKIINHEANGDVSGGVGLQPRGMCAWGVSIGG
jgi:hypothetical protein